METQPLEPRRQPRGHLILTRRPKINQDTIRLIDSRTGEITTVQINRVVGQKVSVSIAAAAAVVIEREEIAKDE